MSIRYSFPAYDAYGEEYEVMGYMLALLEHVASGSIKAENIQGHLDHMVELGYLMGKGEE